MGTERIMSRLFLAGALSGLLCACGSSDSKGNDYSSVKLYVNELQASNQFTITDENGEADDWIELYNAGKEDLDLEGFYISDSVNNPLKHQLPAGVTIEAGGYLVLWADGTPDQGPKHLSFKLSADGEHALVSDPNGDELDSTDFLVSVSPNSWARHPDGTGEFDWCTPATPGEANGDSCAAAAP